MTEDQQQRMAEKKRKVQLQLEAAGIVKHFITYHWLGYLEQINELGMHYSVEYLLRMADEELLPYLREEVSKLDHPLLGPEQVESGTETLRGEVLDKFPSISHFKYVIDLPVFAEYGGEPSDMLREAKAILGIENGPVYFLSSDTLPLMRLQLDELIAHANELFDDGGLVTLIFTDPEKKWLIFRNIEEEWRCGWWPAAVGN